MHPDLNKHRLSRKIVTTLYGVLKTESKYTTRTSKLRGVKCSRQRSKNIRSCLVKDACHNFSRNH